MSSPNESEVIKPSKEWVLPARGKPGRKPSATVPPTKRKAQNRASQRAFRERRHAYVTELEQKVAQFEAREVDANVQMQRIALQYREEADALRKSNEELRARCESLECDLVAYKRSVESLSAARIASSSGCRPPVHERRVNAESPTRGRAPRHTQPEPSSQADAVPLRRSKHEPSPPLTLLSDVDDTSLNFDCGFCTDAAVCVCRGKARLDLEESKLNATPLSSSSSVLPKPRLWHTTLAPPPPPPPREMAQISSVRLPRAPAAPARLRPRLWSVSSEVGASSALDASGAQCTGDQRTCNACRSDPALAEFCSAVSRSVHIPVSTQRDEKPSSCETVPHAFTRLRSHPNFSAWRGGLDMLAEVVARGPVSSAPASSAGLAPTPCDEPTSAQTPRKRQKTGDMMVHSEAVSEALDLLDRSDGASRACPCPWAAQPSRLPWPRPSSKSSDEI